MNLFDRFAIWIPDWGIVALIIVGGLIVSLSGVLKERKASYRNRGFQDTIQDLTRRNNELQTKVTDYLFNDKLVFLSAGFLRQDNFYKIQLSLYNPYNIPVRLVRVEYEDPFNVKDDEIIDGKTKIFRPYLFPNVAKKEILKTDLLPGDQTQLLEEEIKSDKWKEWNAVFFVKCGKQFYSVKILFNINSEQDPIFDVKYRYQNAFYTNDEFVKLVNGDTTQLKQADDLPYP